MLATVHSNRLERLAGSLAELLGSAPADVFEPELVVVQHPGMGRWLSLQLAERLGVSAQVRFPLPGRFIWEIFRGVITGLPEESPFQVDVMAWRIMERLEELAAEPGFGPVRHYLRADDDRQRFDLARETARLFDQYLLFRPDWIEEWENGAGEHWQARLWRALAEDQDPHWLGLRQRLFEGLENGSLDRSALPRRAVLFGIPALSPAYVETIHPLAQFMDVHVYQLNPSREFWQDIMAGKAVSRRIAEHPEEAPYLATGNALLASMGRQIQEHVALLQSADQTAIELFEDPGSDTLLHTIQGDILRLEQPRGRVFMHDDSVQIHVCHSPKREVEVLHDRLLDLFDRHRELSPSDVIVMTPDIDSYAPWIEAVFGSAPAQDSPRFRYSVADREYRRERPVVDAVFRLLGIGGSRLTAPEVLAFLDLQAVRRRFNVTADDLLLITEWLRESGVRWEWDRASRAALGIDTDAAHTWRFGFDRLLLGYAMPQAAQGVYRGILPCDMVEGGDAVILGRFMEFVAALNELRGRLSGTRTITEWVAETYSVLERFLRPAREDEQDLSAIRAALEQIREETMRAGFLTPVSGHVFADRLEELLKSPALAGRFLSGGITFCGLVPMRSVPFCVVCLLGLGEGDFPRQQLKRDFDLMSDDYRSGDRSRRDDDRYLFLEAILSARDHLYLSYTGRNDRDDSVIPPSPLISELLDYLDMSFEGDEANALITIHPLQAFSPRYFNATDEKLFSYSSEMLEAARGFGHVDSRGMPFITGRLAADETAAEKRVSLDALGSFLGDSARFLLRERLAIRFPRRASVVEDHEPFELDTLSANTLRQELMGGVQHGLDTDGLLELARATGRLPHPPLGEKLGSEEVGIALALVEQLEDSRRGALKPRDASVRIGDWIVAAVLGKQEALTTEGLVGFFASDSVWINQRVHLWLRHLMLNVAEFEDVEPVSRWIYPTRELRLEPVDSAREVLETIVELYDRGRNTPVPFFPRSAWNAASVKRGDPAAAAERRLLPDDSHHAWGGSRRELDRSEFGLLFRDRTVDLDDVVSLGQRIFGPLVRCVREQHR